MAKFRSQRIFAVSGSKDLTRGVFQEKNMKIRKTPLFDPHFGPQNAPNWVQSTSYGKISKLTDFRDQWLKRLAFGNVLRKNMKNWDTPLFDPHFRPQNAPNWVQSISYGKISKLTDFRNQWLKRLALGSVSRKNIKNSGTPLFDPYFGP